MTIRECLSELYDEEVQKVFSCSANWLMSLPKKGREEEFERHCQRAEILQNLLDGVQE